MNNPWAASWQSGYYPQPNPNVYIPPQPYGRPGHGFWDPRGYGPAEPPVSGYRSSKYPNLNPILAADTTLLRFDVKNKPRTEILASTYYSNRHSPATANGAGQLRLISKAFPWAIDVISQTPVTCEAIWDALYAALQEYIADSEWGLIVGDKKHRETVEKAARKRADGEAAVDRRLKRIDYLGDLTLFKGLDKDEDFEKMRLLPGQKEYPDTWVVKLGS